MKKYETLTQHINFQFTDAIYLLHSWLPLRRKTKNEVTAIIGSQVI